MILVTLKVQRQSTVAPHRVRAARETIIYEALTLGERPILDIKRLDIQGSNFVCFCVACKAISAG
jgi:hypothetical protein